MKTRKNDVRTEKACPICFGLLVVRVHVKVKLLLITTLIVNIYEEWA